MRNPEASAAPGPRPSFVALAESDPGFQRVPPKRGLILNVFTRIPLQFEESERWNPNRATGRDHLWLTEAEWRSIVPKKWRKGTRFRLPARVAERLVRFHLVDNVRGEPDMWRRDQIRDAKLSLVVERPKKRWLRLEGTARMDAPADPPMVGTSSSDPAAGPSALSPAPPVRRRPPSGGRLRPDPGGEVRLEGHLIDAKRKKAFSRFDLLAWGEGWGHGTYTRRPPEGRFPLVIAFSLGGKTAAERIPPQGSRLAADYFGSR